MFKTSINIFKDNYFFGAGVKSFRDECKKDKYYIIENYSAFKDKPYDHYPGYTGIDGCSTILIIIIFSFYQKQEFFHL